MEEDTESSGAHRRLCTRKKVLIISLLILVVSFLVVDQIVKPCSGTVSKIDDLSCNDTASNVPTPSPTPFGYKEDQACVTTFLKSFVDWLEENTVAGSFLYVLLYAICTILFVPGSVLTIGAGAAFGSALGTGLGVLVGTLVVFVGAMSGSVVAFLLGRYIFRDWVDSKLKKFKVLRAIDGAVQDEGLKVIALLRLSPLIPFNLFNYVIGGTAVSLRDFTLGSVFILPGTVAFVFLGTVITSAASDSKCASAVDRTVRIVILVIGVIAAIVAVVLVSKKTRRVLDQQLEQSRQEIEAKERRVEVR